MTTHIHKTDGSGQLGGSIGDGRDGVPTAAATSAAPTAPTGEQAPSVSLASALTRLGGRSPEPAGPVAADDHPLVGALMARVNAIDALNEQRCRADGEPPVGKWDLDGDDNKVWYDGYAAGMRYALSALTDADPDRRAQWVADETREDADTKRSEAVDYFTDLVDEHGSLDAALDRDVDGWNTSIAMDDLDLEEKVHVLGELEGLSPADRQTLSTLLAGGWHGTYAEAVSAAQGLTT